MLEFILTDNSLFFDYSQPSTKLVLEATGTSTNNWGGGGGGGYKTCIENVKKLIHFMKQFLFFNAHTRMHTHTQLSSLVKN